MYTGSVLVRSSINGVSLRESRSIHLFKEVGSNLKEWGSDAGSTYIAQGWKEGDPIKMIAGIPMGLASVFTEASDYALAGIADQKLEASGELRTWRDIKEIGTNNVRHPIKTVLSGLRLISDIPMDGGDALFGFKHGTRARLLELLEKPSLN